MIHRAYPNADSSRMGQGGFSAALRSGGPLATVHARNVIGELKTLLAPLERVVEIDCGTGLLTGQLTRAGVHLLAVGADLDSVRQLARSLPAVPVVAALSRDVPIRRSSVDAAVIAVGLASSEAVDPDRALTDRLDEESASAVLSGAALVKPLGILAVIFRLQGGDSPDSPELIDEDPEIGRFERIAVHRGNTEAGSASTVAIVWRREAEGFATRQGTAVSRR